jgi:hypothetical protein
VTALFSSLILANLYKDSQNPMMDNQTPPRAAGKSQGLAECHIHHPQATSLGNSNTHTESSTPDLQSHKFKIEMETASQSSLSSRPPNTLRGNPNWSCGLGLQTISRYPLRYVQSGRQPLYNSMRSEASCSIENNGRSIAFITDPLLHNLTLKIALNVITRLLYCSDYEKIVLWEPHRILRIAFYSSQDATKFIAELLKGLHYSCPTIDDR